MPKHLVRSLRLTLVLAAIVVILVPTLQVAAMDNEPLVALAPAATLGVDMPAPNTLVSNGQMVGIGGWTTGSRVDVYLDGPAARGQGIGSMEARTPGSGANGFEVPWYPMDLSPGTHTLYVYSLVDGSWTLQMVPIVGAGNILDPERDARGRDEGTQSTQIGDPSPE